MTNTLPQVVTGFAAFHAFGLRMIAAGYSPVPIGPGTQYPPIKEWQKFCDVQPTPDEFAQLSRQLPGAGIGLACGKFTQSIDFDDQRAIDVLFPIMPRTIGKVGSKGFTLIYRQTPGDNPQPSKKFKDKANIKNTLVEFLGAGNQTVLPPTIHPKINAPYRWWNPWEGVEGTALWDVPLSQLPALPPMFWLEVERRLLEVGLIRDPRPFAGYDGAIITVNSDEEVELHRLRPWAEVRLREQCADLAKLTENRHASLNSAAVAMGNLVKCGAIDEVVVYEALEAACNANGFFLRKRDTEGEFDRQVGRGLTYGAALPLNIPEGYFKFATPAALPPGASATPLYPEAPSQLPAVVPDNVVSMLRAESAATILGRQIKARKWAVDQWVPGDNVTLLVGDGGTGKSLLALLLAACIATGTPFFGLDVVKGPALYISAEDEQDEVDRRVHAIARRMPGVNLADLHCISLDHYPEPAIFAYDAKGKATTTALLTTIENEVARLKPRVLVLDPLADLYACDEVKRPEVRAFISALRRIARNHQCAVVLLAHPSVEGMKSNRGYSGSTAWNNSVRSRLLFGRPQSEDGQQFDEDWRELSLEKSNRSKIGGRLRMKWVEGVFVAGNATDAQDLHNRQIKTETVFMQLLRNRINQTRDVSPTPRAGNYAPKVFADDLGAQGISEKGFKAAMEILLSAGKINVERVGREKDGKQRLMIVS